MKMSSNKEEIFEISNRKIKDIKSAKIEKGESFPKIAVFIVAYNAALSLERTLERIPKEIYDILECIYIIDDFSDDETYQIGKTLKKDRKWEKVEVFRNPRNYGYGGNQKIGYRYAIEQGFDYVILLHGDGQYAPELLPDIIYPVIFEGKEVVFGSRIIKKVNALKGKMPLYKFIGNIILTKLQNILLNTKMSEFHSGYRLYSTNVLSRIPFELNSDDFNFDTQIIIQCFALGIDIYEIPISTFYGDEICYVNGVKYAKDVIKDVIEYRLNQLHIIRRSRYIIEDKYTYELKKSPYSSHQQIAKLVKRGKKVLDVGCASGFISTILTERNVEVWGIDKIPREQIKTRLKKYILHDLEEMKTLHLDIKYDYIICSDIIEKVRNPKELLVHLRRFLKSDGRIILSTGNIAIWFYRLSLLFGRFKYVERGILDKTQVKLYTFDTFKDLIELSGFKILNKLVTPIPFELVFASRGRSKILKFLEFIYYYLAKIWPRMFAYQFIFEAEISSLDFSRDEGHLAFLESEV